VFEEADDDIPYRDDTPHRGNGCRHLYMGRESETIEITTGRSLAIEDKAQAPYFQFQKLLLRTCEEDFQSCIVPERASLCEFPKQQHILDPQFVVVG
jgi:hypothetical protein